MNILKAIDRLVGLGYPESTAKKIASGELPMDTASRMARAGEQGFTTEAYHAGYPNILEFDALSPKRTIDEGYHGDNVGSFFADDPIVSASYGAGDTATYKVLLNPSRYGSVDAGGNSYAALDGIPYIRPTGEVADSVEAANTYLGKMPSQTDDFGIMASNLGDAGVEINRVSDVGPSFTPMKRVADALTGGNARQAMERIDGEGARTTIVTDPSTVRSFFSAAFDPDQIGNPNIMAGAGGLGILGALGISPDASAAPMTREQRLGMYDPEQLAPSASRRIFDFFAPESVELGDGTLTDEQRRRAYYGQ